MDRVKERGVVHTGWVQQQLVLAHNSVGCYVCHSGFSSVIEAIVNDCQLVLLPFKGDQIFNAKLIAGVEGMCIRANHKKWRDFFSNEEIQNKFIGDLVN
ncbi:hypothetical protein Patl1_01536 [Pistacia atlantica]|uniref:Uncharacterized protein n=1 Tax=Pistacia atlantica TaxID=434234 RepID=A0ACC1CAS1_9ROSI|nr:hypothetical protein Patl1_01536 [Pistacia atlantica]